MNNKSYSDVVACGSRLHYTIKERKINPLRGASKQLGSGVGVPSPKRSYFAKFTQEIYSSNKGQRTNKQVSNRAANGEGKGGNN